jgi:hypothetical protein
MVYGRGCYFQHRPSRGGEDRNAVKNTELGVQPGLTALALRGAVRIATDPASSCHRGSRCCQHWPSGVGEGRNIGTMFGMPHQVNQHRLSGVGEDRNEGGAHPTGILTSDQHRPSGVGEDRNYSHDTAQHAQVTGQYRPSGGGEDRNLGQSIPSSSSMVRLRALLGHPCAWSTDPPRRTYGCLCTARLSTRSSRTTPAQMEHRSPMRVHLKLKRSRRVPRCNGSRSSTWTTPS